MKKANFKRVTVSSVLYPVGAFLMIVPETIAALTNNMTLAINYIGKGGLVGAILLTAAVAFDKTLNTIENTNKSE